MSILAEGPDVACGKKILKNIFKNMFNFLAFYTPRPITLFLFFMIHEWLILFITQGPLLNISRGGGKKNCILLNLQKTTSPIQDIFRTNFVLGVMIIQFVANLCGKNLKLLFQGQIFLSGISFLVLGNLKSLFLGQIFFILVNFVYGKS